jgi:hypothetical protein
MRNFRSTHAKNMNKLTAKQKFEKQNTSFHEVLDVIDMNKIVQSYFNI